jgi:hypothetical protein
MQEDKEFERRMRVADTLLKEKAIEGKTNANNAKRNAVPAGPSQQPLQRNVPAPREDQLNQLETKVEELSNASKEGPKTSTSGRKRVQQTKADA